MGRTPAWRLDREIAPALASAALAAPVPVAAGLVASALVFRNVGWAVAACFMAGRLARPRLPRTTLLGAALILVATIDRVSVIDDGRHADLPRIVLFGACAGALLLGARSPRLGAAAAAPALASLALLSVGDPFHKMAAHPQEALGSAALAAAATLVLVLAARRRAGAACVVLLMTAGLVWAGPNFLYLDRWRPGVLTPRIDFEPQTFAVVWPTFALLPVAHLAGTIAAEIDAGARADGGDRLVVFCQRRPWLTSLVLGVGVAVLAGPWTVGRFGSSLGGDDKIHVLSCLPLVVAAFAALGHVGRGARSSFDRLAPWLAANLAVVVIAYSWAAAPFWPLSLAATAGLALLVAEWPLACAALLPGDPPADRKDVAAAVFPIVLCLAPTLLEWIDSRMGWDYGAACGVMISPLAVHALVRSRVRARWILLVALVLGWAWELLTPGNGARLTGPVVWLLCALCVLAARRCRQMTAVPRDHPVVADFGGS